MIARLLVWLLSLLSARPAIGAPEIDAAIVPGCPSEADGRLSFCQWRRATWAAMLYRDGVAPRFITSGAAVHTPWPEARMIRAAMIAQGVPGEVIHVEEQALHTDENIAYSMALGRRLGWTRFGIASDASHVKLACKLLQRWDQPACVALPMDYHRVHEARLKGWSSEITGVEPEADWVPLATRERRLAREQGRWFRRPPSWWVYTFSGVRGAPTPPEGERGE